MLAQLFGLLSLVFSSSLDFPKIEDKDFDSRNIYFPSEVTLNQLKDGIRDMYKLASSVLLMYLSTKGAIHAKDPYMIFNDVRGTKTAFIWMSLHNRLNDLQTNEPNMESIMVLYHLVTHFPLHFQTPVYRKGVLRRYEVSRIQFSADLKIPANSNAEEAHHKIQNHVANILERMGVVLVTDFVSNEQIEFLFRMYFKALRLLHYASLLFHDSLIDNRLMQRGLVIQELMVKSYDREADFDTFFKPTSVKIRLLNEILFRGNMHCKDPDYLVGELLANFDVWERWVNDEMKNEIVDAYIVPYEVAKKAESLKYVALGNVLIISEMRDLKRANHVNKELTRIRKTIESIAEEVEVDNDFEIKDVAIAEVRSWKFSELTHALSFTVKIILAQYYRESFLLPIADSLEGDVDEEASHFSWETFVADENVQEKALKLFNLSPEGLSTMAKVVTERNDLVHRRDCPTELRIRSKWNVLFGSLAHDAMDIVDYAGIKVAQDDPALFDNIQPCITATFAERTYAVLTLLLICEKNPESIIKEQCAKLSEYRNGYAHPTLSKYQRLIPHLVKIQ